MGIAHLRLQWLQAAWANICPVEMVEKLEGPLNDMLATSQKLVDLWTACSLMGIETKVTKYYSHGMWLDVLLDLQMRLPATHTRVEVFSSVFWLRSDSVHFN